MQILSAGANLKWILGDCEQGEPATKWYMDAFRIHVNKLFG